MQIIMYIFINFIVQWKKKEEGYNCLKHRVYVYLKKVPPNTANINILLPTMGTS